MRRNVNVVLNSQSPAPIFILLSGALWRQARSPLQQQQQDHDGSRACSPLALWRLELVKVWLRVGCCCCRQMTAERGGSRKRRWRGGDGAHVCRRGFPVSAQRQLYLLSVPFTARLEAFKLKSRLEFPPLSCRAQRSSFWMVVCARSITQLSLASRALTDRK